jgi:sarcosine oxidase subunit alpha
MELLKRGTLAGTGTCQGGVCTPYLRSFLQDRGHELQAPFTFRPMARQLTLDELAAGAHLPALSRTALDGVHRSLGAHMDRMGGWWRPWNYGDTDAEYAAVRERVSLGDVSTLGKMIVTGPDAEETLQRLFPTNVATIKPGRSRYVLMLNERGYVMDDGMIAREHDGTFFLTFTSGGASMAEMWIRDWSASWGHDIRILNQTLSLGAINVTGPKAAELLQRATTDELPAFLGHAQINVAGVPCKIFRLSFTGEMSFELHHPAAQSVELWTALMELGADLSIAPHGIEALFRLRLEKGHIIVGMDTDMDASPRRLQHEWAVNMTKGDFIGRTSLLRTNEIPLDRKLVGFETERALFDGAVAWSGDTFAGTISSSAWSPTLGKGVALGWLESIDGDFPETVLVDGIEATVVAPHFYDPEGTRARA